ncbi:MAG: SIMPL domain-containing protein [Crocinitomicaceae bacterium]
MRKFSSIAILFFIQSASFAQVSGNINYQKQVAFPEKNIDIRLQTNNENSISVKGLANVKADAYIAIFNVSQEGKTAEEVNELIDKRISESLTKIKLKKEIETYVDMISFVPVYEYEVEKKIFSKKNYMEIPVGFELKKTIHIRYTNPNFLNEFIEILSQNEIYDLVRVDYFSTALEAIKKELMTKAKLLLTEKTKNYEAILGETFANTEKQIADGFKVVLPVEMYQSYEAYSSSSLNLKRSANVNVAQKSKTLYYQPIVDKEFDFVINPVILEPVIQVMYELKLSVLREKKTAPAPTVEVKNTKEYILITPNGDLKNLNLIK